MVLALVIMVVVILTLVVVGVVLIDREDRLEKSSLRKEVAAGNSDSARRIKQSLEWAANAAPYGSTLLFKGVEMLVISNTTYDFGLKALIPEVTARYVDKQGVIRMAVFPMEELMLMCKENGWEAFIYDEPTEEKEYTQ